MKIDSALFFISLFFTLVGLLLEDVSSIGLQWLSVFRYLPILLLYIKYFNRSFPFILPILFAVFLLLLSYRGGHYSAPGLFVTIMLPVSIFVFTRIRFSTKEISIMAIMMTLTYFLYVIIILSNHFDINPNQESFKVLILTAGIFFCKYTNSRNTRISSMPGLCAILGISLFLILYTESRNSLLVFLLLVLAFICRRKVAKMNVWGIIMLVVLILFILYPFTYCLLSNNLHNSSQNTEMLGQDVFSGRQYIWSYIFAQLVDPSAFFYGGIDMEWWGKSMHNSALDIVVRYGVPTMVAVLLMVLYYFKRVSTRIQNRNKPLLLLVVTAMIWGLNESGLFLGFSFLLFMPYSILLSKNSETRPLINQSKSPSY